MNIKMSPLPSEYMLEPGSYIIVDPCYVFPDGHWSEFCEELFKDNNDVNLVTVDGGEFIVWNTLYGDGTYPVYEHGDKLGECGVDAGLLAVIPLGLFGSSDLAVEIDIKVPSNIQINNGDIDIGYIFECITSGKDHYKDLYGAEDDDDDDAYDDDDSFYEKE